MDMLSLAGLPTPIVCSLSHCWLKHAQARWCQLLSLKWVLSRLARHWGRWELTVFSPHLPGTTKGTQNSQVCKSSLRVRLFSLPPSFTELWVLPWKKTWFYKKKTLFQTTLVIRILLCFLLWFAQGASVPTCSWVWRLDPSWYFGGCGVLGNKGHSWKK